MRFDSSMKPTSWELLDLPYPRAVLYPNLGKHIFGDCIESLVFLCNACLEMISSPCVTWRRRSYGEGKGSKDPTPPTSKSAHNKDNATDKKRKIVLFPQRKQQLLHRSTFKIPRLGASPAAPAGSRPPPAPADEEEAQDVIEDEFTEPGLKDFADDIRAAFPTYTNVAG